MSSIILAAASDIFVIAGATAVATVALKSQKASFKTTLGADDDDDDSLVSSENREDAVGTPQRQKSSLQCHIDDDKKAPTATIDEVAATPPAVEMLGSGFFVGAKAA